MNKDNKLIPRLRFPEFKNSGEWAIDKLGNLVEIKGRIGYRGYTRADIVEKGKGAISLSPTNFNDNGTLNFEKSTYISWDKYNESPEIKLKNGQTVLVKTASVGKSAYVENLPEKTTINPQIVVLKPKKIQPRFLSYTIFHQNTQNKIKQNVGAGAIPNLSQDSISKFLVPIPQPAEQQKIASCLSSLDELLEVHKQKLELLKAHKKGLMQNLFPQEGEKVPKLRFPEFKDSGEWEVEPFGDIYIFKTTNSFSRSKLNYEKGTAKNIHYGDIHTKFSALFDITKENVPYINSDVPIDRIGKDNYCIEGDMVFADASEDLDDVGKSIEIVNVNNEKLLSGLHTFLARQTDNKLIIGFGGYLFKSNTIRNQIRNEAQGAKVLGISKGRISNIKIYYPKNKIEQQKIVECLSSVDELITAEAEKIEQLEKHKKGLMQGLFPEIN